MVNTLLKAEPQLAIVGLVDPAPEAALARVPEKDRGSVGVFQTIGEMVGATRPDALAIGSRCDSHARLAIEASAFGLPLFLEKPVATRMEDALALEEAFRSNPCPVLVSFPLRASLVCQHDRRQGSALRRRHTPGRKLFGHGARWGSLPGSSAHGPAKRLCLPGRQSLRRARTIFRRPPGVTGDDVKIL